MNDETMGLIVVRKVIADAIGFGFKIDVNDGEEDVLKHSTDIDAILAAMFSTDEDYVHFRSGVQRFGWIRFVYGHAGHEIICDYTMNLEQWLKGASALCDELERDPPDLIVDILNADASVHVQKVSLREALGDGDETVESLAPALAKEGAVTIGGGAAPVYVIRLAGPDPVLLGRVQGLLRDDGTFPDGAHCPTTYTHAGYRMKVRIDQPLPVAIHDPRDGEVVMKTTSLDLAIRWIDAYREGIIWAVQEQQNWRQNAHLRLRTDDPLRAGDEDHDNHAPGENYGRGRGART